MGRGYGMSLDDIEAWLTLHEHRTFPRSRLLDDGR
jgi:hypothetical protein